MSLQTRPPAITARLAELQSWRYGLTSLITRIDTGLVEYGLQPADLEGKLARLYAEVEAERLKVLVLGDSGRGKSELINAVFFPDVGHRLLPLSTTHANRAVIELRFDSHNPTGVHLLPMETRPQSLSALHADMALWTWLPFDADRVDSVAGILATLHETTQIDRATAVARGFVPAGEADVPPLIEVARWRYAIVNFPHPLLDAGLVITEAPMPVDSQSERIGELIAQADALLMVLDINAQTTRHEYLCWQRYFAADHAKSEVGAPACLAVLNKLDTVVVTPEAGQDEARAMLRETDRRIRAFAENSGADPTRVIPVSAGVGLVGQQTRDNDKIVRSRLYLLERVLAKSMPRARQSALGDAVVSFVADMVESAQHELDEERFQTLDAVRNLGDLRAKNEKLAALVKSQAAAKQARLAVFVKDLHGVKALHARLGVELDALVDTESAKNEMHEAVQTIHACKSAREAMEVIRQYLDNAHVCIEAIDAKIEEVRGLFTEIGNQLNHEFPRAKYEVHPFPTQRFSKELHKIRMEAVNELLNVSSLRAWRAETSADHFMDTVGKKVVHIFEIARREATVWLRGLYSALEAPIRAEHAASAVSPEMLDRVKAAEMDLAERIAELQSKQDVIKRKHAKVAELRAEVQRFANADGEVESENSASPGDSVHGPT